MTDVITNTEEEHDTCSGQKMHSQEDDFTSSAEDAPFCVVKGWQQTSEARGYVNTLLKRHKRRHFGEFSVPFREGPLP